MSFLYAMQWMYPMSNTLLCCHSQHIINLLDTNVEFTGHFLRCDDRVSGLWLHHLDLNVPNFYTSEYSFCHQSLHKNISNDTHGSVNFNIVSFWSLCNFTYFTTFFLLLSLYQLQSNLLRIPLRFTHNDNMSKFHHFTLGRNSLIKMYCISVSFKGNEHPFVNNTKFLDFVKWVIRKWHSHHSYFIWIN